MPNRRPGLAANGRRFGLLAAALLWFVAIAAAQPSEGAGRQALVIGNGAYRFAPTLRNPTGDARAIADSLGEMGYTVTFATDLALGEMGAVVASFARDLKPQDTAVVFFAGHGLLVNGSTYLMPVDALMRDEHDLITAFPLERILAILRRELRASIVLIDACRDNPLLAAGLGATRRAAVAAAGATAEPPPERLPFGMVVGYAAQPGSPAYDGNGDHSPYVTALLRHLRHPTRDVELMLRDVRREVVIATGGAQVPWTQSSLLDGFSLANPHRPSASATRSPNAVPGPNEASSPADAATWTPATKTSRAALRARLCAALSRADPEACRH